MRIRKLDQHTAHTAIPYQRTHPGEWIPTTPGGPTLSTVNTSYSEDVVTPRFKEMRSAGNIVNSPFFKVDYKLLAPPSTQHVQHKLYGPTGQLENHVEWKSANGAVITQWTFPFTPMIPNENFIKDIWWDDYVDRYGIDEDHIAREMQILLRKSQDSASEGSASLPVTYLELPKTLESIKNIWAKAKRFGSFANNLRTHLQDVAEGTSLYDGEARLAVYRALRHLPKTLAGEWLEFRYAHMQLYYDVKSYVAAYEAIMRSPRQRFVANKRLQPIQTSDEQVHVDEFRTLTTTSTRRTVVQLSAGLLVKHRFPSLRGASELGLDRPFSAVWDLTRLSFVIDWLVDIGPTIGALETLVNREILAQWTSVKVISQYKQRRLCIGLGGVTQQRSEGLYVSDHTGVETVIVKKRTAAPSVSYLPSIRGKNLGIAHLVDTLALVKSFEKTISSAIYR